MNEENRKQNDEINLLDLFTVFIRYRKLIIISTLIGLGLAIVGYFVYPVYQYSNALKYSQANGRMLITIRPNIRQFVSTNPDFFVNRADLIIDSLREAGMEAFEYAPGQTVSLTDEAERSRALYMINQFFVKNMNLRGKVRKEENRIFRVVNVLTNAYAANTSRDNFTIEVNFTNANAGLVMDFLNALYVRGNVIAQESLRPAAENLVHTYELLLTAPSTSESTRQTLERDFEVYVLSKGILDGTGVILSMVGEPVVTYPEVLLAVFQDSYLLKGIILVLVGIFIGIFLAFVLNTIRNVRNDPESMEKINDALGKTNSQ